MTQTGIFNFTNPMIIRRLTMTFMICSSFRTKSTFFCVVREARTALWFLQASLALSYDSLVVLNFRQEFPTRSELPGSEMHSWLRLSHWQFWSTEQLLQLVFLLQTYEGLHAPRLLFHMQWIPGQTWLQDAGLEKAEQLGEVYISMSLSSRLLKPPNTYITL
ncbi:hypothetical protein GOODEAATRI_005122 [Goodea atripinnis]|uniref:Uncharacterized protein n=1 Tax=Goodea atripinnis TaxID=208336 RepID=A0ABV0PVF1_9TELE